MTNTINFPVPDTSFVTVKDHAGMYTVVLSECRFGESTDEFICATSDRASAYYSGRRVAARIQRPFKSEGASQ